MILAIDIGNTTVTLGGVRTAPQQAYSLEFTARIDINHTWSASQYESAIEQLFEDKNLSPSDFRGRHHFQRCSVGSDASAGMCP